MKLKMERICNGNYQTWINGVKIIISKNEESNYWEIKKRSVIDFYGKEIVKIKILERHDTYGQARKDLMEQIDFYTK